MLLIKGLGFRVVPMILLKGLQGYLDLRVWGQSCTEPNGKEKGTCHGNWGYIDEEGV